MRIIKLSFIIIVVVLNIGLLYAIQRVDAALKTTSNSVTTRVGNAPASSGVVCPIKGGKTSCGPSYVNIDGKPTYSPTTYSACNKGHCAGDYCPGGECASYCYSSPSTSYAIDVPGPAYSDVYLPEIIFPDGPHPVTCSFVGKSSGTLCPSQIIAAFSCSDDRDPKTSVWIQFHHVLDGSEPSKNGLYRSGDAVVKVDPDKCNNPPFAHVHVQIGINGPCKGASVGSCVAADKYLQC